MNTCLRVNTQPSRITTKLRILFVLLIALTSATTVPAQDTKMKAVSRLSFYTTEADGEILLLTNTESSGDAFMIDLIHDGKTIVNKQPIQAGVRTSVSFPLNDFIFGDEEVVCRLYDGKKEIAESTVVVTKLLAQSNEVKVDRLSGLLIVDGLPFFPFGFYCYSPVQPTLAEEEIVKGFNMMSPYQVIESKTIKQRREYMDRCAELGMKVHYNLISIAGDGGVYGADLRELALKDRLLEKEVLAFKDHPALLAWYICDEPTGDGISPERLVKMYNMIKKLDPYHPITIVFMASQKARLYADSMDIVMADPYPIPHKSIKWVGEVADRLVNEFAIEKPTWIVPQAFGGHEWWTREPTKHELRVMTYLAIIKGATGIQYFIRHGMNSFPKSTTTWGECGAIAREMAELTPAFYSSETAPAVTSSIPSIQTRAWRDRGVVTVLAVNTENSPAIARLQLDEMEFTGKARVIFENRNVQVESGVIEEMIDAFGTRAYQIEVGPFPEERFEIYPDNMGQNPSFEENPSVGTPAGCYASVGDDRGGTYFVDSRVALHGRHSLRLTTPQKGEGFNLEFFPVKLEKGKTYRLSIWAKAAPQLVIPKRKRIRRALRKLLWFMKRNEGLKFKMILVGISEDEFRLTPEWKQHILTGTAKEDAKRFGAEMQLISQGTAWFDLIQIIEEPTPIETK